MRKKSFALAVLVGIALSVFAAYRPANAEWLAGGTDSYCISDASPCVGRITEEGNGCSTYCLPMLIDRGCCGYVKYRIACKDGVTRYQTVRTCEPYMSCGLSSSSKGYSCRF